MASSTEKLLNSAFLFLINKVVFVPDCLSDQYSFDHLEWSASKLHCEFWLIILLFSWPAYISELFEPIEVTEFMKVTFDYYYYHLLFQRDRLGAIPTVFSKMEQRLPKK